MIIQFCKISFARWPEGKWKAWICDIRGHKSSARAIKTAKLCYFFIIYFSSGDLCAGEFIIFTGWHDDTSHNAELRNQGTNYSLIHSIVKSPKERGVLEEPGLAARLSLSAALKFHFASLSSPWVKSYSFKTLQRNTFRNFRWGNEVFESDWVTTS